MKKIILLIILILGAFTVKSNDSLRVYAMGYFFHGEHLRIRINKDWYYYRCNKGLTAFSFYIPLPDSVKSGDLLDMAIFRRGRLGLYYKYTGTEIFYEEGIKYCFLLNNNQLKRKSMFEVRWTNGGCPRPHLPLKLFDQIIPEGARLKKIPPPW